ncbi:hypothetical protein AAKU61_003859 [Undibacterium sp. GrIS 1.2]|uniref:hypothetical protein n=1 Tax=Undibacterium sp. GrIS 1.2 TaxID=3143933 RepID=UPI0033984FF9
MFSIEFSSAKFLPFLPEDRQANPGVYGFELALWLSQALMKVGIPTSYPLGDDWGWFIEYAQGESEFSIGCSSQTQTGDGYKGQPIAWRVFVKQELSLMQRFMGGATSEAALMLFEAIKVELRSEGILSSINETA